MLAAILRRYEVTIADDRHGGGAGEPSAELVRDLLAYEPDGSLLVPAVDVPLRFRRVDEGG